MKEKNQNKLVMLQDLGMMYPTDKSSQKTRYGLYLCSCGKKFKAIVKNVKNNATKSCGCYHIKRAKESSTKHGLARHRLYDVWNQMMQRCYRKTHKAYKNYGGRGISVCDKWHNIRNFIEDMDSNFKEGLTLDREKNDENYDQANCRWTTTIIQNRNKRIIQSNNKSGYKGVSFNKKQKKFMSQITVDSKVIYLGVFSDAKDAGEAYDSYIIKNNLEHTKNK